MSRTARIAWATMGLVELILAALIFATVDFRMSFVFGMIALLIGIRSIVRTFVPWSTEFGFRWFNRGINVLLIGCVALIFLSIVFPSF